MISHENIASRAVVFESYDKQVQGRTIIESGMSDAGVMAPFNSDEYPKEIRRVGIALSTDHNPNQSKINPYLGGMNATLEAMRNVVAVGATPHALSDCLCFGNPEKPHQMWEFVEAVKGVSDACKGVKLKEHPGSPTPIIAGNVSFYNESKSGSIPPSPIISCLGKMNNVDRAITMSFKKINSKIFMIGKRKDELGGSLYYSLFGELGANVPSPDLNEVKNQIYAITDCIDDKLIESCHDISDGGIAVALSEMTFENNIGCSVTIPGTLSVEKLLFSETGGFIIEVEDSKIENVNEIFNNHNINLELIGETCKDQKLVVNDAINMEVEEMKSLWTNGLREKIK
jgi:phosphoribosylformylglycinamidine synthase